LRELYETHKNSLDKCIFLKSEARGVCT